MTLLGSLFEQRSIENPAVPLTSASLVEWLDGGHASDAGIRVSESKALTIAAVWRAVNMTAGVASALPLKTYRLNTRRRVTVRLLDNPHPDMTPKELWETVYVHLLLWGNAYLLKVRNPAGMVTWLLPIPPSSVKVGRVTDWQQAGMTSPKVYEVTGFTDGSTESWTDYEVLHLPGLGYDGTLGISPIAMARQSLGVSLAAEKHAARLWGSGSMLAGILQSDQKLTQEQADAVKARWKAMVSGPNHSHDIAVLGSGATFQPVTMPNDDAQFLESRRFQVDEVARWYGVPPHMLFELSGSTSWGTGIEQQTIGWVQFSLAPMWLRRVESRLTKEATPSGTYAEYAVEGLLRGDSKARSDFYKSATGGSWMTPNEARVLENLQPLDGLDEVMQPLNMAPAGQTGDDDADQAA